MLRSSSIPVNPARFEKSCAFVFLLLIVTANSLPQRYSRNQRTIRLCSKSLSDALYLVCNDRGGYNEPYSYSSEEDPRASSGLGLVDECCYRPCSYEQLEQYCKPLNNDNTDKQDGIEESLRIVNLPYSPMRKFTTGRKRPTTIGSNSVKLNPVDIVRHSEANEINEENSRDRVNRVSTSDKFLGSSKNDRDRSDIFASANVAGNAEKWTKTTRTRLTSQRRKRPEDAMIVEIQHREIAFANVPKFKSGTTLPDTRDSAIFLFPSRTNAALERAAKDLEAITDIDRMIARGSIFSRSYPRQTKRE